MYVCTSLEKVFYIIGQRSIVELFFKDRCIFVFSIEVLKDGLGLHKTVYHTYKNQWFITIYA